MLSQRPEASSIRSACALHVESATLTPAKNPVRRRSTSAAVHLADVGIANVGR